MLRAKDCVVKEYFVNSIQVNENSSFAEAKLFTEDSLKGIKFREENFKSGLVLDLNKDPSLNATHTIIQDLSKSLMCSGQENTLCEY